MRLCSVLLGLSNASLHLDLAQDYLKYAKFCVKSKRLNKFFFIDAFF